MDVGLKFILELKDHYKLKYCTLIDNSTKKCNDEQLNFPLMYTLLNGHTWYGSRGFGPKQKFKYDIDEELYDMYKSNRKIIKNIYVKDLPELKQYLLDAHTDIKPKNINKHSITNLYENNLDKKLCNVIGTFLNDFDETCSMFKKFYIKLVTKIGLYDFSGKAFILYF